MTIDSINSPGTKISSTNQSTNNNSTATRVDATFYRQLKTLVGSTNTSTDNNTRSVSTSQLMNSSYNSSSINQLKTIAANTSAVKESDWLSLKPEWYSMEKFQEKLAYANYKQSLLDPEILPQWVTRPETGINRSTDMVSEPSFQETVGGVFRIDYTVSGQVKNFIPSYQWRKTASSSTDSHVGNVYNQQTPWGFRTMFIRDGSGRTPDGYTENAYEREITAMVDSAPASDVSPTLLADESNSRTTSPPANLSWQERLVFYNNPASYLLANLINSTSDSEA